MMILSIALALTTILAAVAAGVGGSIAAKRGDQIFALKELLNKMKDQSGLPAGTESQYANSTSSSSNASMLESNAKPTSNCTALGGTCVSAWTENRFDVQCGLDYTGSDMLGVWVITFAECMEACASWNYHADNPRCYSVSYDISNQGDFVQNSGLGNCFFKSKTEISGIAKESTDSADFRFSS
ncbi:MAG: hypothetical protein Q9183_002343 [Haloplaca sp. 2 TL-2023]